MWRRRCCSWSSVSRWERSPRPSGALLRAQRRTGEIRRIYRVAGLGARGKDPADVIRAATSELSELLELQSCTFEVPPFTRSYERLDRSGVVTWSENRIGDEGFALPAHGVALDVLGRGMLRGRFVMTPKPGIGVSLEQRVVAVAIADQVGATLASARAPRSTE
jgi:hypothetical protein